MEVSEHRGEFIGPIDASLRVSLFILETLTASIGRTKVDASITKTVVRITPADLIVVDDIGMPPAGRDAAEAFHRSSTPRRQVRDHC